MSVRNRLAWFSIYFFLLVYGGTLTLMSGCGKDQKAPSQVIEQAQQEVSLFNGEFIVKKDGIYTFTHYYKHPQTGKEVMMVGMNHGGDAEYYQQANEILRTADLVIYEGVADNQPGKIDEAFLKECLAQFEKADFQQAFMLGTPAYFMKATIVLKLTTEDSAFNPNQPGWISGDAPFYARLESDKAFMAELQEMQNHTQDISDQRKKEIVDYIRQSLVRMENGDFSKRDFGQGFVFFWNDKNLVDYVLAAFAHPRDELLFAEFDKLMQEKNPNCVGIKFGAAHINNQRKLLEARGYQLVKSVSMRNIAY